jgi:hypothetical protein
MNLSLTAFFNLRLAHITQVGYHRSVQFFDLAGAPFSPARGAGSLSVGGKGTGRPLKQVHRTNRKADCELTPAELSKRYKNLRYQAKVQKRRSPAFFQQAKAQLDLLTLVDES